MKSEEMELGIQARMNTKFRIFIPLAITGTFKALVPGVPCQTKCWECLALSSIKNEDSTTIYPNLKTLETEEQRTK